MTITQDVSPLYKLLSCLPQSISLSLSSLSKSVIDRICEIRLHSDGITGITIDGKNMFLSQNGITSDPTTSLGISNKELNDFLYKFCKGSIFTHENTLPEFFIVSDGIRVGIGGEAVIKSGNIASVSNISSLNIRIPRHINNCSDFLIKHIEENGFPDGKGILIISSPGIGKTTILRDLAKKLSQGTLHCEKLQPRRVCVIDERHEIFMPKVFNNCCIDFLSGISKIKGIEIASRVLSPEIIICDEIASQEEAKKITERKNSGIIFIASMHSDSYNNVIKKEYVYNMFSEGIFGTVCCLTRKNGKVAGDIAIFSENA